MMKRNKKECPNCKRSISISNFNKHYDACINERTQVPKFSIEEKFINVDNKFKCKECSKVFETKSAAAGHYWAQHTEEGRKHVVNHTTSGWNKGITAWNKGLTTKTDDRVKAGAIKNSITKKGKPGTPHTEETKKRISETLKKYMENNPDRVPYILNHSSKISYPEQYFIDCFSDLIDATFQYPVFRYKLDFVNIKEKLYFEVDGNQHYSDKKIVAHDIERTEKLLELGWVGIRLRWSEFQKMTDEQKREKVIEVIEKMKWEAKKLEEPLV